ncbi:MAG: sigma-70 family RNA polymerase sigma factor [Verrucomicrobiota bacterium]
MMSDDMTLVREFAASQSEPAFAELVQRHVGLVHSAAMRQVGDMHLAEEIAQAVFIILARKAPKLGPKTILSAWLYRTARYAAADALTARRRRQAREQEAHMQSILNEPDSDSWKQLAPLLDDAMAQLGETDRAALVLRYFENKSAGEIAGELRMGEEAAQKRVARALEKLRAIFVKQGVTLSVVALGGTIAANSVQAVPAGLTATISAATMKGAAVAISVTTLVNGTIKTISMTTIQKTLITAAIIASVATPLVIQHQAQVKLRDENQSLRQQLDQQSQLAAENERLSDLIAKTAQTNPQLLPKDQFNELLRLRGEVGRLRTEEASQVNDPTKLAAKSWINRVTQLKQRLEQKPEGGIPELKLLGDEDWLAAVKDRHLDTENQYRRALSALRGAAEEKFADAAHSALSKYLKASGGQFPTDLEQLKQYFDSPIDDSILQRWQIVPGKTVPKVGVGELIITEKSAVDDILDKRIAIGDNGRGSMQFLDSEIGDLLKPARTAYLGSHGNWTDFEVSKLMPFAKTPEEQAAVQKLIQQRAILTETK